MSLRLQASESSADVSLAKEAYQKYDTVRSHLLQLSPGLWNTERGDSWHETGIIDLQVSFVEVYLSILIQEAYYNPSQAGYLKEEAENFKEQVREKLWQSFQHFAKYRMDMIRPSFPTMHESFSTVNQ